MSELEQLAKKLIDRNDELKAQIDMTMETLSTSIKLLQDVKEENDRLIAHCHATIKERREFARSV